MRLKKILYWALIALLSMGLGILLTDSASTQSRSVKVTVKTADGKLLSLYSASYALVVGVSDYTHGWPDLREVVNDTREVKAALEQHGFIVTIVENPTAAQLENAMKDFITTRGLEAENRLLFYFAGHGYTQKKAYGANMGYIVPSDAPLPDKDQAGFLRKAISMENFNSYAREINAKHVLFIFDSCFSGRIFALARAVPAVITYKTSEPVRQFVTAGSADETVPDKSIFKQQFLAALNGEGDSNGDGYITGNELGEFLQTKVVNYTRESQHPQYGKIRDPQLDKGDFVFVVPTTLPPTTKFDPSQYEAEANRLVIVKVQWDKWQQDMNASFQKAQNLDHDANLSATSKAQMWKDFLNSYATDNPYSQQDDSLRLEALRQKVLANIIIPSSTIVKEELRDGMVLIPAGSFMMGSNDGNDDEKPEHRVYVDAFYIEKSEVTVAQYQWFLNAKNYRKPRYWDEQLQHPNCPVVYVSWGDAVAYAKWAEKRLPTEAEWEYAARGGYTGVVGKSKYKYPWGNEESHDQANYYGTEGRDQWNSISPVRSFPPNGYDLYDMAGNVWEWCADWYDSNYYQKLKNSTTRKPSGPSDGRFRVLRGGSLEDVAYNVSCAIRSSYFPSDRGYNVGFRCVQDVR